MGIVRGGTSENGATGGKGGNAGHLTWQAEGVVPRQKKKLPRADYPATVKNKKKKRAAGPLARGVEG